MVNGKVWGNIDFLLVDLINCSTPPEKRMVFENDSHSSSSSFCSLNTSISSNSVSNRKTFLELCCPFNHYLISIFALSTLLICKPLLHSFSSDSVCFHTLHPCLPPSTFSCLLSTVSASFCSFCLCLSLTRLCSLYFAAFLVPFVCLSLQAFFVFRLLSWFLFLF